MADPRTRAIDAKRLRRYGERVRLALKLGWDLFLALLAFLLIIITFPIWIVPVAMGVNAMAKAHANDEWPN